LISFTGVAFLIWTTICDLFYWVCRNLSKAVQTAALPI